MVLFAFVASVLALAGGSAAMASSDEEKRKKKQKKQPITELDSLPTTARKPTPKAAASAITFSESEKKARKAAPADYGSGLAAAHAAAASANLPTDDPVSSDVEGKKVAKGSVDEVAPQKGEANLPYYADPKPKDAAQAILRAGVIVDEVTALVYDLVEPVFVQGIDSVLESWDAVLASLSESIPDSEMSEISSIPKMFKPDWSDKKKWSKIKQSIEGLANSALPADDSGKLEQLSRRIVFKHIYDEEGHLKMDLFYDGGQDIQDREGGGLLSPSAGSWEARRDVWEILFYVKTFKDFMGEFGAEASVHLEPIWIQLVEEFDLPRLIDGFWDLLDLPCPKHIFQGATKTTPLPSGIRQVLDSPISQGIIDWDENAVVVPDMSAARELLNYCGKSIGKKKSEFLKVFNDWGFSKSESGDTFTFTHDLFRRDEPHLCMRMGAGISRNSGECNHCGEKRNRMSGSSYCPSCASHDTTRIPLGESIDPDDKVRVFALIDEKMTELSAKGDVGLEELELPTQVSTPKEVFTQNPDWEEYLRDGGAHDQWLGDRAMFPYDELDDLSMKLCGRARDKVTHLAKKDLGHAFVGHFSGTCLKAKVGACYYCLKPFPLPESKDACRLSYGWHWDHIEKPPPGTYVVPCVVFCRRAGEIKYQLAFCVLTCTGCHEFGTTRGWVVDRDYVCKIEYPLPEKARPMAEVLASLERFRRIFKTEEMRYGGLIPKVSEEDVKYFTMKTTGFLLSDVVTWQWERRSRTGLGSYFVMDLYINLTKKMQGKCIDCGADIANRPPLQLSLFHGDHGEGANKASGKKQSDPTYLRNKATFEEVDGELGILRGWCCAACHGKNSRDIGVSAGR